MEYKDPRSLLCIDRLDVFLKKLYFDVIGGGRSRNAAVIIALYRKHIMLRTGGIEPPDQHQADHHTFKSCVDDYEREALALYRSMEKEGFREDRWIAISRQLLLVNGAHRLAAAISLGLEKIPTEMSAGGGLWGAEWFQKNFSRAEYLFLMEEYAIFQKHAAPILLWGMTEDLWADIMAAVRQRGLKVSVVRIWDLGGNFDGFYRLVHELYAVEPRTNMNIRRKAIIHGSFSTRMAVLQVEPVCSEGESGSRFYESLSTIKREIRELFSGKILKELFLTIHTPDGELEKRRMVDLLYSPAGYRFYRWYRFNDISMAPDLWNAIRDFKSGLDRIGIRVEDVCVVSSAVLGVFGIRRPADIDLVVSSKLSAEFTRTRMLEMGEFDVKVNGYDVSMRSGKIGADELIYSSRYHFSIAGVKFVDPSYVFLKKKINGIPKDVEDVRLMRKARRMRRDGRTIFMREELLWLESGIRLGFT
jgi:hypothetical protein